MMKSLIYSAVAIIGILVLFKVFEWPIKVMVKLVINGVLGVVLLLLVNFVGKYLGVHIAINVVTSLIAGFLGVPGVLFLVVYNLLR